jgi:hypothetical protein
MTMRTAATACLLLIALAWLHALGDGDLSAPPWSEPASLGDWVEARGAAVTAFALLRQAALLICCYLLATALLGWTVRTFGMIATQRVLDRITVPALHHVLGTAVGAGLTSMVALGGTAAATTPPPRPGVAVIHRLDPPPTTVAPSPREAPSAPAGTASMRRLDTTERAGETWTVEPGDSFWLVASSHLAELRGEEPSDREVTRYWLDLIEANRSTLPDPLNPDLLFPSAVLVLPPA